MKKIILLLFLILSFGYGKIILGVHPISNKAQLKESMKSLTNYLSKELDEKVVIFVGKNYKDGEDRLINGQIDLLIISPYAMYKMLKKYTHIIPMTQLKLNNKLKYRGAIIVSKNSNINELHEIKNRSFIFGDPSSTFAYAIPKKLLKIAGIRHSKIYSVTTQPEIIKAISSGKVVAGGVKESFAKKNLDKVKIIKYSKYLPTYAVAVNLKKVDRQKIIKVKKAFLNFQKSLDMGPFGIINKFNRVSSRKYSDLF